MNKVMIDGLLLLSEKEAMLSQIIVWLRAKGLWEECQRDLIAKVPKAEEDQVAQRIVSTG